MDEQTQSFLELTAKNDLVQLAADKRAAWLWSADGARVLWANAAGASFFSARTVSDLKTLAALERSPARPHIARIAETGASDRFSIDRLRFYRGLRVMLLTCQCKRLVLDNGEAAALIVCGDKGLALTREPVAAFAQMIASEGVTAFLTVGGKVAERIGPLDGTPEDLDLPEGQNAVFGPLELGGGFHEGVVLNLPEHRKLVLLENAPLAEGDTDLDETGTEAEEVEETSAAGTGLLAAGLAAGAAIAGSDQDAKDVLDATEDLAVPAGLSGDLRAEEDAGWVRADDEDDEDRVEDAGADKDTSVEDEAPEGVSAEAAADGTDETASVADLIAGDGAESAAEPATPVQAEASDDGRQEEVQPEEILVEDEQAEDAQFAGSGEAEEGSAPDESADETDSQASVGSTSEASSDEDDAAATGLTAEEEPGEDISEIASGATGEAAVTEGFTFQPRRRPVRFAWKMDIDQRFTFLSDEFADVLGPIATDIVGLTWEEVSDRFDLDPRGQIARALDRRDTWSGKTVNWPVSGAALRVPVDMAALPAFDRHRKFEGYRGFGVCRTADAVPAPDGLMLSPALAAFDRGTAQIPAEDETVAETAAPEETVPEQTAPEETDAVSDADASIHDDVPDKDGCSAEEDGTAQEQAPAEPEPGKAPAAEASVNDLKPAKPDSFAGKTFLGASAAALVGSLAKFTGKSAPKAPEKPAERHVEQQKPDPAAPEKAAETAETEPETVAEKDMEGLPGAALDDKLLALESGKAGAPKPEEATADAEDADADAEMTTDFAEAQDEDLLETEAEDTVSAEEATAPDIRDDAGTDTDEETDAVEAAVSEELDDDNADTVLSDDAASEEEPDAEEDALSDEETAAEAEEEPEASLEAAAEPVRDPEPTGIAGPAALKPAEIESAVKSLAKAYKQNEKKSRDLFDETVDAADGDDAADAIAEELLEEAEAADTLLSLPEEADGDEAEDDNLGEAVTETEDDEDLFEPVPAFEDAHFDLVEEEDREIEATAEDLEKVDEPEDAGDVSDEERDFFEETAAFESKDKAAETDVEETPQPKKTGEVIPLATVKPRLVPVDTSGLSRPERQAFRKIAEALGARLEGDLDDFDAPDPEKAPEEEQLPEVPEAGPIDPSLLDRLPIGIAIAHDRDVLYANKALLRMLGYKSVAALAAAGGLEALFIDDTEELPDAEGMDGEVDETMKLRLADGGVLNVDAHMHSVPWNGNRGLMISITERKAKPVPPSAAPASPNFFAEVRAELDSARNQIAEMDTILETATDGVLVLDLHGTIIKVNGSAEALFSANRSDMIGAPFTEFLAPESHRAAADYLDGLTRNGVASILNDGREVLGKVPAGGLIPLFMTIGRISGNKEDAKYCAVLRDITQWKTAEEELTQAKRQAENASSQKSDFLAKISHEIRTPLNAIIGFSEVMMEERFGPIGNDRYKDYLKDIRTSGSHIMSLINDLLDLSKIEAGKLDLKFSAVSTNDVISECVALMQPQANRERVIIRASLPESVPNVVADPRSLRQIVLNLLSNAIKYNKSGGQVILSTALESNGEVALRVRDTGTGMTAKQLAAALEPFRQLHTASRGGGTGLGLPLTKALVEANRASFHIDSTPDQGTLVEITFPTQRVLSE